MGYQFIRIEGYARKGAKTKSGDQKLSIREILDEVQRVPGNIPHIPAPQPPKLIFGGNPAEIEQMAEDWASESKDAAGRKIRSDGLILLAGVASIPREYEQDFDEFTKATLAYLKEKYGDRLKSVVSHNDEAHPHLHFYVLPKIGEQFEDVHQGYKAAKNANREGKVKGEQNQAYKGAMRAFQDDFSDKVAMKFGLTRVGPKLLRLSRKEWWAKKKDTRFKANLKAVAEHGHKKGYKKGLEKAKRENEKIGEKLGSFVAGALRTLHKPTATAEAEIKQLKTEAEEAAKKHDHDRRQAESKARSEKAALAEKLAKKTREAEALEADLKTAEQATAKAYELATFYEKKVKSSLVGGATILASPL